MNANPHMLIFGAGSIGCFIGGLLQTNGNRISFLGRKYSVSELQTHGLHLTDFNGMNQTIPADALDITDDETSIKQVDIILVCVKSSATQNAAETIRKYAKPDAIIVSLQNGVRNADVLSELLPDFDIRAGMVPFNVVNLGKGHFHRGTSGILKIASGTPDIGILLNGSNLECQSSDQMQNILWGKLLVNLNNALNALSDMPLVDQLSDRDWRKRLAQQMDEALTVMNAADIQPTPPSPVPAWVLPYILRLPTPLFRIVAKQMLAIDPKARSSMWEDLQKGRQTEIDEFQGEIIRLGKKHGIATPEISKIYDEIIKVQSV
jgi:2-dehydropantoate 2-reductase